MQGNGGCLVFCTTKGACENGAKTFVQQAAAPSEGLLAKRWSVTLDLLAAQASQIHEPLGSILKYSFFHTLIRLHLHCGRHGCTHTACCFSADS